MEKAEGSGSVHAEAAGERKEEEGTGEAHSSFKLLLEEGTSGYVMPVFTGSETRGVACIKIIDFSQHCHSQAKNRKQPQNLPRNS